MLMANWRRANNITLDQMADLLGLRGRGHLSKIERGLMWPRPEIAERIRRVTLVIGPEPVGADDHLDVWRSLHTRECSGFGRAARSAAKAYQRRLAKEAKSNGSSEEKAGQ